jgi:hypothetical protein
VRATDAGSGVDPGSLHASVDGRALAAHFLLGRVTISTARLERGRHHLVLRVSDHQEAKNMENSGPILPNTRRLSTTFTVR